MHPTSVLSCDKSVDYLNILTEIEEDILLFKIHSGGIEVWPESVEYELAPLISASTLELFDPFDYIKNQALSSETSPLSHNSDSSSAEVKLVSSQMGKRRPRWPTSTDGTQSSEIAPLGGTVALETFDNQLSAVKKKKIIGPSKPFVFEPNDFSDNGESPLENFHNVASHRGITTENGHKPPLDCLQANGLVTSYSKGRYWNQFNTPTKLFTSKFFNRQTVRCHVCGDLHVSSKCPSRLCYNCYIPGHHCQNCSQPRGIAKHQCWRCESYGHLSADCPTLSDTTKNKAGEIACCNCSGTGHLPWKCKTMNMDRLEAYIKHNGVDKWLYTYYQKRLKDVIRSDLLIFPKQDTSASPKLHSPSTSSSSSEDEDIIIID
ncbi:uncharacterized protein LOC126325819 [Schistocerca gregaria]|uniref:uncharacterized protein LOC126325819 n=1 Tax=Schistocerca gregaria TaxID=7010 RepID=UPI00211DD70E|nr:uncharacterized protein LOC126325819 [Schistocerca gregaria]